jgi:hypothetical protein
MALLTPLLISAHGFVFRGALVEPPRLCLWGFHQSLFPAGVFAFRSNNQLCFLKKQHYAPTELLK